VEIELPRAKNLNELRQALLFNNTLDVWIALMGERNKEWRNPEEYNRFLDHLAKSGIKLDASVVCPPIKGFSEKPPKAFNIRLDDATIQKIRLYSIQ
jgi:hypothetical protein